MADTKLSALTELATTPANDDEVYIRDVSEASAAESKRITIANLIAAYLLLTGGTMTGNLVIDEGGLKIILADDAVIQLGVDAAAPNIFGGVASDPHVGWIQPKSGNTEGVFGILPKGTSTSSNLLLSNSSDVLNMGYLLVEVRGDYATLHAREYGTGTPLTRLRVHLPMEITENLLADHSWSGTVITMVAGEDLVIGDACYVKNDGKLWKADADATTTMPVMVLATATISADDYGRFLTQGFMRDDTWNWTVGGLLYASCTTGALTQAAPSEAGDQVQVVGIAMSADIIHFNPSYELVEIS